MNDNNKRKLYDALSQEYDMGTFEQFSKDIEDEAKRRKLYESIKGTYDLPDFNGFSSQLGVVAAQPQQTEQKQKVKNVADTVVKPVVQTLTEQQIDSMERTPMASDTVLQQGKQFRQAAMFSPNRVAPDVDAEQERAKERDADLQEAYAERKRLKEKEESYQMRQIGRMARAGLGMGSAALDDADRDDAKRHDALLMAQRQNEERIAALEESRDKNTSGFWRNLWRTVTNPSTWSFGLIPLSDAVTANRVAGKMENDSELTDEEETLLQQMVMNKEAKQKYGDDKGFMARAGTITGEALPFVTEFLLTGGYSGVAHGVGSATTKGLAKMTATDLSKKGLRSWLVKSTGTVVGDVAGATLMANTTGAAKTASDAMERHRGSIIQDDNGDYHFGHYEQDEDGNSVFVDGGKTWAQSIYEAEAANTLEYYTEMLGTHMEKPLGAVGSWIAEKAGLNKAGAYMVKKLGLGEVSKDLSQVTANGYGRAMKHVLERGGIQDYPSEVLEEEANIILNSMFVGDNSMSDLVDGRTQADIWGGMLFSVGFMSSPAVAGGTVDAASYLRTKHSMDNAERLASYRMTEDRWKPLRERIDGTSNEDFADLANEILADEDMHIEEKKAVLKYMGQLAKFRGFNVGSSAKAKDEVENPSGEQQGTVSRDLNTSYIGGYEANDEQLNDIKNGYEFQRQRLSAIIDDDYLQSFDQDPVNTLIGILSDGNSWSDEEKQTAIDYVNAKAAYDGMIHRVQDDIDGRIAMSDAMIESRQHHDDGMIHPATMKTDDRKVYVIGGKLVMNEDGTMIDHDQSDESVIIRDAATGAIEFADPHDILSTDEALDAAQEKEVAQEAIRQQYAQEAANKIDGVLPFNNGDTYQVVDEQGQQHTVTVIPTGTANSQGQVLQAGDGEVVVSIDGADPVPMSRETIQQMFDNTNLARLQQYEQEQAAHREEQAAAEREANRPVYNINDEVTLQTEEGTVRGSITAEANEDGLIEVYTEQPIGGKKINLYNRDQLDGMVVEHNGAVAEPQPVQNDAGDAGGEATVTVDEPMPMIGEGEDAEPDFSQATPQRAHTYIYNEAGLSRDEANQFIEANKKAADKELEKVQGKKPKMGTSLAKYRKETAEWQQKVEAAQQVSDYWKQVKDEQSKVLASEAQERAVRDAAVSEQAVIDEQARQAEELRKREEQAALGTHNVAPAIREKWESAHKVEGARNEIVLANGERVPGRYILVESGAATPSHNPSQEFVKNEGFPMDENGQSVNDRDYERDKDAQATTRQIASVYDQRALQTPVVVTNDGIVLSGNGRTMAGELAAQNDTDGAYIEHLKKYGQQFGFTSEQVDGMQHPRVLFVPDEAMPYTTDTFAKFNAQEMKGQSKTEQAVKLGKVVGDETFGRIIRSINSFDTLGEFYNDPMAATEAINELRNAGAIGQMDYAEMFDGDKVSEVGRQMLENMLIGKAFESNPDAVRQLTEIKSLRQSVINALAEIVTNMQLGKDYTLEGELAQAINLAYKARKSGYKDGERVSGFARQLNLFPFDEGETIADYNNATVLMLADVMNDSRTNQLKKSLAIYNHHAADSAAGQMDIFSGGVQSKEDIIKEVLNILNYGTEEEQQQSLAAAVEQRKAAAAEQPSGGSEGVQQNGTLGNGDNTGEAVVEQPQPVSEPAATEEPSPLAVAEQETDTNPTEAQKAAGNYKKGHVKIDGFDVSIENPKGSTRSGKDASGKEWSITMNNTYGYIRGTEGVDGDHIDVFLSDNPESGNVYVIDQRNADGSFDEHKVMYGFNSAEEARQAYLSNYEEGWQGLGAITEVSKDEFKKWVNSSHRKTKPFAEYKSVKPLGGQNESSHHVGEQGNEDVFSRAERIAMEDEARRRASEFATERSEESAAFDKRVPDMTDEELLAYMSADGHGDVNKAYHTTVYDEYDYRHSGEQTDAYDAYTQMLHESATTKEQAEEMLAGIRSNMDALATDERPMLLGQEEALQEYIDELEAQDENERFRDAKKKRRIEQQEIGFAMTDRLEAMGFDVSIDPQENRRVRKIAEKDQSDAGKMRHFETPDGKIYGFVYKGKIYLDPSKIDAELPIHEYAHPWCEALRKFNPDSWRHVVDLMKSDQDAWAFVKSLNPDLENEDDIAEEMIAKFSGKKGAERARAAYERLNGKESDYKSKWGNIWNNISKSIQDFWKQVGDFLHINYDTAEQVYDQVVKDFANKINPRKLVEDWLKKRDAAYMEAVASGDNTKAKELFDDALRENIGNGMTPFVAVSNYRDVKRLALGIKNRDPKVIAEVADLMAPIIPKDAVLVPAPSHSGEATDMLDLAQAISERTGAPVADVLKSGERDSQYQRKKSGSVISAKDMGIVVNGELPKGKLPVVIDNVVDTGNTAEACVHALGKGVVVSLADSVDRYKHVVSLKSAEPVVVGKDGKVVPLSKRFDLNGRRYLDKGIPSDKAGEAMVIPMGRTNRYGIDDSNAIGKLLSDIKDAHGEGVIASYYDADNGVYYFMGDDAGKVHGEAYRKGALSKDNGMSLLSIPENDIDTVLPVLTRKGYKTGIVDKSALEKSETDRSREAVEIVSSPVKSYVQGELFSSKDFDPVPERKDSAGKPLSEMSDEELLRAIGENEEKERGFHIDEYDKRHREEYDNANLAYAQMLEGNYTSLEDAYAMYDEVTRQWRNGGYASPERTRLLAQIDALEPYIKFQESERYDEEMEKQREMYEQQKEEVRSQGYDLTHLKLRPLEPGESCHVERRYKETGLFSFTGSEYIESIDDVAYIFRELEDAAVENTFLVLEKNGVPTIIHLAIGSYSAAHAPFEQAFAAIQEIKPDKVYFVHNHPSGRLKSSNEDRRLIEKMHSVFGDKLEAGIIIDTTSGKFGLFYEHGDLSERKMKESGEMSVSGVSEGRGEEVPLKVYSFSKQVFDADWNPDEAFDASNVDNVAAFISSHRLGEHDKMSLIVLDQAGHVTGNIFLPWTTMEEAAKSESADLIASYASQMGGTRVVVYGNYKYESTTGGTNAVSRLSDMLKARNLYMQDVIHIDRSAYLSGDLAHESSANGKGLSIGSVDVTPEMKESVMQGQPMFRDSEEDIEAVNERFNRELQMQIDGTLPQGHIYDMGMPSDILLSTGIANVPIQLNSTRLESKSNQFGHDFALSEIKDLVKAINDPVAIFAYGDKEKAQNIIVEIQKEGNNFVVGLSIRPSVNGRVLEVNSIRNVFPKKNAEWLNWINQGKLLYVDKEKIQNLINQQRTILADVEYLDLDSAAKVVENFENPKLSEENLRFRIREDVPPRKTGIGYKVFVLKDGQLYPPMVANPDGAATPTGVWLDADAAPVAGMSKTGRAQVKAGGKGTQGGSGTLAYRPGWHLGTIPYALQFNRKNPETGERDLFPANFVWAEVEYANDVDYQQEAHDAGVNANGKYQHSLAGLKRVPVNGSYMYRTNPNPETDPWIITGAMKVKRILKPSEVDAMVKAAGREPQQRQDGYITDTEIEALNKEIDTHEREGEATKRLTYEESLAMSRRAGYTKKQHDAWKERAWRHMHEAAESTVERLGLGGRVTILESADGLKGRKAKAKGWFDAKTGKIVVVLGNHRSVSDVVKTILHEGVAHYGLRRLFGMSFDQFLDNVYQYADESVRREIVELAKKHGWDFRVATEEYLARLAEDTDFERATNQGWWSKIKSLFLDMLHHIGLGDYGGAILTNNELRYILWRSYENMAEPGRYRNPFREAEDISMQMRLGVGSFDRERARIHSLGRIDSSRQIAAEGVADGGGRVLFRDGESDGTREAYDKAVNTGRKKTLRMTAYNFREAFQDALLSVRKLQEVVEKKYGVKLSSHEDAWKFENALSSINMQQTKKFVEKLYEPMMKIADKLLEAGATVQELNEYLICKHGLERNMVFAQRDFEKYQQEHPYGEKTFEDFRRDYSGLTAITGKEDLADIEAEALKRVQAFEKKHGQLCSELWDAVNKATKWTLEKSYQSGMMSKDTYEKVRDMFHWYVPLRGWDADTAEDVYDYMMSERGVFNGTLKKAEGRTSLADDPLATIGNMGESAILQGNRNLLKRKLLNMAMNYPTDVCSVRDMWIVENAQGEWEANFPRIPDDATADEVAQLLEQHEADMEALAQNGKAKRVRNSLDIDFRIDKHSVPEHAVVAYMNGRQFVVYINGNPRAAQAINGRTGESRGNSEDKWRKLVDFVTKDTKRYYSSAITQYSPNFAVANIVRDLGHSIAMTYVNKGVFEMAKFVARLPQSIAFVLKNQAGVGGNTKTDKYFKEFVENGGITGYAHLNDVDRWKADNAKRWARLSALQKVRVSPVRGVKAILDVLGWLSETLELTTRFNTYQAERRDGKDVGTSIKAAKDITVNFNKKGSEVTPGIWGAVANTLRFEKMFFNPIVQGLNQFFEAGKAHPVRFAVATLHLPVLGAMMPYANMLLVEALAGGDGDDDKDKYDYWLQNEYTRRNNVLIFTGKGYIKIPIAPGFRELYGMGEAIATRHFGKADDMETAKALADQLRTVFSVEGQAGYSEWSLSRFLLPEHMGTVVDVMNNENFTGGTLYNENIYREHEPEYQKAKQSTWSPFVSASKQLNEWARGDEDVASPISGKWMNPAVWQHIVSSYGGGFAQLVGDVTSTASNVIEGKEQDSSQWPMLKRFYAKPTDERANWARYGKYKKYKEEYDYAREKYSAIGKKDLDPTEEAEEISRFVSRHPKAAAIYDLWEYEGYVEELKELRQDGEEEEYWQKLQETVETTEDALRHPTE